MEKTAAERARPARRRAGSGDLRDVRRRPRHPRCSQGLRRALFLMDTTWNIVSVSRRKCASRTSPIRHFASKLTSPSCRSSRKRARRSCASTCSNDMGARSAEHRPLHPRGHQSPTTVSLPPNIAAVDAPNSATRLNHQLSGATLNSVNDRTGYDNLTAFCTAANPTTRRASPTESSEQLSSRQE